MGNVGEEFMKLRSEIALLQHSDAEFKDPLSPLFIRTPSPSAVANSIAIDEDHWEIGGDGEQHQIPKDAWLPITESRNGNAFYVAFHILNSNIGFQALMLPLAFPTLGWAWGSICLSVAFLWQLYTIFLLVRLHESIPGVRFSRYLFLATAAFGKRIGMLAAIFPVMYLSGGSCVMLVIIGGGTMRQLFQTLCERETCDAHFLSGVEWFVVFTCIAILMAQLPNLNSIAAVSLVGFVAVISYCTLFWALSLKQGRPSVVKVSYTPSLHGDSTLPKLTDIINAIGFIVLAFRGHNLLLEIQGTLPSSSTGASQKAMCIGVSISYILIAMCVFPLAIAGFWAYGDQIDNGGLLTAFPKFHRHQMTKFSMGAIYLVITIHCLCSFQIYAMPAFDNLELRYTGIKKQRCPRWVRACFRVFFGGLTFSIAVTFPFLPSLAALFGGMTLVPLTYAYPCFMWIAIKKPPKTGAVWCFNVAIGSLGLALGALMVLAAVYTLVDKGLNANFFKP